MEILLEVPVGDAAGSALVVEADQSDLPGELTLASRQPGEVAAKASRSLTESLAGLQPMIQTVRDSLVASGPESFSVEFGVKLGGETGVILAKGTAEVNLKVIMSWERP